MARILLVDPPEPLAAALAASAALEGCEIVGAAGNVDALRRLRAAACDVLVTCPATSVDEDLALLEEVRQVRPGIRAIVLAGRAGPESVVSALRESVFAVFSEPLDAGEIAVMVRLAVDAGPAHDGIEVLSARADWLAVRLDPSHLTTERLLRLVSELRSDVPGGDREDLVLAYREVLQGAMDQAAREAAGAPVDVVAVRTARAVVFYVRTPGPGFELADLPHAAATKDPAVEALLRREEEGRPSGAFGLLVARTIVDEMLHNERGDEVLLVKHTR
jgi:DNA-binding NarL/FixJ family response regulator